MVYKSGLGFSFRALEVPFLVPPKPPKMHVLAIWGVPKMALPMPETKIRDHFYKPNTPPKPSKNVIGNAFRPLESGILAISHILHILASFLECKNTQNLNCIPRPEGALKSKS